MENKTGFPGMNIRKTGSFLAGFSSSSSSSSSSSASSTQQKKANQQTNGKKEEEEALKKKVDDLLRREAAWKRTKALKLAPKLCHWADCPFAEVAIEEDMWTHIMEVHVFWQPFFDDAGKLMYGAKEGGDQQIETVRSTRPHKKDHVCRWELCPQAERQLLMQRSELIAHIKRNHLVKPPPKKMAEEYTKEVMDFMEEEVVADLKRKAGLAAGEPAFKEKVLLVATGELRDLKPGELGGEHLSDGEKFVRVLDERFWSVQGEGM
ncbi:hypothetical protein TYRP_007690 [Tyrophagus putrescentiae]|nr:hypothetical protein TYRP_007690 [Tyrophagus putrescentiae]